MRNHVVRRLGMTVGLARPVASAGAPVRRKLLWIMTTAAIIAVFIRISLPAFTQLIAVRHIEALRGQVFLGPKPWWLPGSFGQQIWRAYGRIDIVDLNDSAATDADLGYAREFGELRMLLLHGTHVTDEGMRHLAGFRQLEVLDLSGTRISNIGLAEVKELPELRVLNAQETTVTDGVFEHLKRAPKLTKLSLFGTNVTPSGIETLENACPSLVVSWRKPEHRPGWWVDPDSGSMR